MSQQDNVDTRMKWFANWIRPLLGLPFVQRLCNARVGKTVIGPDQEKRADQGTYVGASFVTPG